MKKNMIRCMCLVSLMVFASSFPAFGSITIQLFRASAICVSYIPAGDATTVQLPSSSLVQLIWSADQNLPAAAFSTADASAADKSAVGGAANDYLIWHGLTPSTGGWTGDLTGGGLIFDNTYVGGQNINNGYLYAVVYATQTPGIGTYYGYTQWANVGGNSTAPLPDASNPLNPVAQIDASPTGERLVLDKSYAANTLGGNQVVAVPEPSTIGLLLVGAGLVAFRRMRRS